MSTKKMQIIGLKGKSAYQYAQDGGYTGTEAEFKEKMAKELEVVYDYEDLNEAILATAIKQEVSGEFIHVEDSAALPIMNFGMEGKTEQKSTEGTNYLDLSSMSWFEWDEENNGYKIISKAPDLTTGQKVYLTAGSYTYSHKKKTLVTHSAVTVTIFDSEGTELKLFDYGTGNEGVLKSDTFSIDTDGEYIIGVYPLSNNIAYVNSTLLQEAQIRPGTTVLPYEPYTGNQPSPNPDYPQEITNAGVLNPKTGMYEIGCKVINRNLLPNNPEKWDIGKMLYWSASKGTEVGWATRTFSAYTEIEIQPNTNICFHNDTTDKYWVSRIVEIDSNRFGYSNHDLYASIAKNYVDYSFKTLSNTVKLLVEVRLVDDTQTFTEADLQEMKIAFGYGDSVTYAPHSSQPLTLTSPVPLTKWDKLVKRDGVYGWSVNSKNRLIGGSNVYDFSNGWGEYRESNGIHVYSIAFNDKAIGWQTSKCTTFRNVNNAYNLCELWTYSDQPALKQIYFCTNFSTAEEWKAYLDENPLDIWYQTLEEQSFHPLPDEEQALLKSVETYYQVTNIFNDQNCPMSIQYIADTQTYVDNLTTSLTNAVVSLGGEV